MADSSSERLGETEIVDYLSGYTDVNTTLDSICRPVENSYKDTGNVEAVQGSLSSLWASFAHLVERSAHNDPDQDSLVDLLVALAKRPTLERNGQPCIVSEMTVWKDLPMLGWGWRDVWNFNPSNNTDRGKQNKWLHLNAFTCRITTASQQQSISPLDFSLYGIWTVRQGLEDVEQPSEGAVEAAAIWFIYGASTMFELSQGSKTFQGKLAQPGALFQDRGWTGYSTERWKVWADRLAAVQDSMSDARAAGMVEQARDAMAACQSSSS